MCVVLVCAFYNANTRSPALKVKASAILASLKGRCPLWVEKRTCAVQKGMSALPPKADMCSATRNVRFVPKADISKLSRVQNEKTASRRSLRNSICQIGHAARAWLLLIGLVLSTRSYSVAWQAVLLAAGTAMKVIVAGAKSVVPDALLFHGSGGNVSSTPSCRSIPFRRTA